MATNGWNGHGLAMIRGEIAGYWHEVAEVIAAIRFDAMARAAELLLDCEAGGRLVFVAGNGGSAATASHLACDLAKGTRAGGPPTLRVVALTDNVPLMTAWANDAGYDRVFAEQLASLASPGDLLIAISASGNSPNVVAAARTARRLGVRTVALTGRTGGRLARLADAVVRVPAARIEVVEDAHLMVAHSLCVAVRERLAAAAADRVILHAAMLDRPAVDLTA